MNRYRNTFSKRHTFLAVIHVEGGAQALRNARLANDEGADGIFLINHSATNQSIPYVSLLDCYEEIRSKMSTLWIGVNCLDLGRNAVNYVPKTMQGIWADSAGIDEKDGRIDVRDAENFSYQRRKIRWAGIYFGGVAFKYQRPVTDVEAVARKSLSFVDVVTTSGRGTGEAADLEKIRAMKMAIGNFPLAVASGVTPENVEPYMPYVDCFLVATGVSYSHTELNRSRVRQLSKILNA